MAIIANPYWTLLLLFAGAAVSYAAGFMVGFWLFIAVGECSTSSSGVSSSSEYAVVDVSLGH